MNMLTPIQTEYLAHVMGSKPQAPSKTFIRVSRSLELTRSPVDGNWRAWVPTHLLQPVYVGDELPVASEWGIVAVAPKAAAVISRAKELGFH